MNNISQISVFDYREIEILGDLERIKLFFENLDDKEEIIYDNKIYT